VTKTIYEEIISLLREAVQAVSRELGEKENKVFTWSEDKFFLTLPSNEKFGDYASNIAFFGATFTVNRLANWRN